MRGAEFQLILPSKDSSFTDRQLAQLGTIVIRLLRLSDSTLKAEYFLDSKYLILKKKTLKAVVTVSP